VALKEFLGPPLLALGRVITATYDNGTQITYAYDGAGNRTTQSVVCGTGGGKGQRGYLRRTASILASARVTIDISPCQRSASGRDAGGRRHSMQARRWLPS
jgi:YD repeat-containing protein